MIDVTNCGTAVILVVGGAGAAFAVGKLARLWFEGNAIARKLAEHKARTEWRNAGLPHPTRPAPPMPNVFTSSDPDVTIDHYERDATGKMVRTHGVKLNKHRHHWIPIVRPADSMHKYPYHLYECACGRRYSPLRRMTYDAPPPRPVPPRPAPPPARKVWDGGF